MHACMHAYSSYEHADTRAFEQTHIETFIPSCIHTSIHPNMHTYIHMYIRREKKEERRTHAIVLRLCTHTKTPPYKKKSPQIATFLIDCVHLQILLTSVSVMIHNILGCLLECDPESKGIPRVFKCNLPSHPWDTHYQFSIKTLLWKACTTTELERSVRIKSTNLAQQWCVCVCAYVCVRERERGKKNPRTRPHDWSEGW